MTSEKSRKWAHDLTIEYIRKNNILPSSSSEIPKSVEEIAKIYESFYHSIAKVSDQNNIF